jgi:SPOR domain
VEASSGGAYAVQLTSERSAAEAHASFRALRAKFPNQLGGREPIVRRTDLGAKGIYYRASIGPFVSMKAAARVCSSLKAAGESCLVEKN